MPLQRKLCRDGVDVWVWKITETADELSLLVPGEQACYARETFASEIRRAEWLAVRAIVAQQFGDKARVVYDVAGKPSIGDVAGYISVSHTKGYAVVAFSRECEVGVDVELVSRDVLPVAGRFMPAESLDVFPSVERNKVALLNWCAKEALFKITGDLGGNFKDNISVGELGSGERGRVTLTLTGVDCLGEPLFVADYSFCEELLVVLCRKQSAVVNE
jgi:phosphopantetheinyl transferase